MLMKTERELIVEFGIKATEDGLVKGTAGNISIYDPEQGYMVIKPSGLGYYETKAEDIVVMKLDGTIIEGTRKPSSEWAMHAAFYEARSEARSVVHTHQPYCTVFACLRKPVEAVHYVIAGSGARQINCADYATFGTQTLADNAISALGQGKAVLLANHGLITYGVDINKAYGLAKNLEYCAEMQWKCMTVGEPAVLSQSEMDDVMIRFKTYGQPKKNTEEQSNSY